MRKSMIYSLAGAAVLGLMVSSCQYADNAKLETLNDSISYAAGVTQADGLTAYLETNMGVAPENLDEVIAGIKEVVSTNDESSNARFIGNQLGLQIKEQILPYMNENVFQNDSLNKLNEDLFFNAFFAMMKDGELQMDPEESAAFVRQAAEKIYSEAMESQFGENKVAGKAFLENNAKQEGVQVTESGLQYKVIKKGFGKKPTASSTVKVHYHGTLIDGTVFDSSVERNQPAEFALNSVIPGWTEGLQLMQKGAKYTFYIPYELGYGDRNMGEIPPFSTLIFDVELLDVK